jgi:sigma-E factor negative regulatory protein RseA
MKPESQGPSNARPDAAAEDTRASLSALADGDAQALHAACSLWRDDEDARQTWHTYHLIGDVMRSDQLASAPARDAAFMASLRLRLAAEPVVLAPAPVPARRRQPWLVPAAAAAGFLVVAGVLVVSRVGLPGVQTGAAVFASASGPAGGGPQLVSNPVRAVPAPQVMREAGFIRDARLDEYLRAHQQAGGGVAAVAPGGALRRVEITVPASPER